MDRVCLLVRPANHRTLLLLPARRLVNQHGHAVYELPSCGGTNDGPAVVAMLVQLDVNVRSIGFAGELGLDFARVDDGITPREDDTRRAAQVSWVEPVAPPPELAAEAALNGRLLRDTI